MPKRIKIGILFILVNLLATSFIFGQVQDTAKFNLNAQIGLSTRFGMPVKTWSIIPTLGLDINSGIFGFRGTLQYFETHPKFDIDSYLAPISSQISQTGTKIHSNLLVGFNPYLNLPQKRFTIQPSLALNYLLQSGASFNANYSDLGPGAVMDASTGNLLRDVYIIVPNVRVLFGINNLPLLFYAELGYSMVANIQEYTIASRKLDGVIRSDGSIDRNLLEVADFNYNREDIMNSSITFSIGVEYTILGGPKKVVSGLNNTPELEYFESVSNEEIQIDSAFRNNCSNSIVVHDPIPGEEDCCYAVYYDLNMIRDCVFDKVIINALDEQKITVNYDLFGATQSNCVSQHIIQHTGSILPFGSNHFLAEICACPTPKGDVEVELVFINSNNIVSKDTVRLECYQEPVYCMCKFQEIRVDKKYYPSNSSIDLKLGATKYFEFSGFCYPEDSCENKHWWTITYPDGSISAKDYIWHENITFNQVGTYELTACIECQDSLETCCETIFVNVK